MRVLKAICIALSTYSILPAPRFEWTDDNMRFSLCALPVVGVFIGGALLFWDWLCCTSGIGPVLFAAIAAVIPLILSGGIHMDGFCDTVDAIASHQPRARKLEILKDSHTGAFAIIYCVIYLLTCFGLYTELPQSFSIPVVCVGFILSRACAVLSAVTMPNARKTGMLAAFADHIPKRTVSCMIVLILLLCAAPMILLHPCTGMFSLLLCGAWFFAYRSFALCKFGGATGDTTGFFLQITELLILVGAVIGTVMERTA